MARVPFQRFSPEQRPSGGLVTRRTVRGLLAVAMAAAVGLLPGVQPAHAAPSPAEIEAAMDKQWEQLEPTIEQHNKVHSELQANQKKVAELAKKLEPLRQQTAATLEKVGFVANRYYKSGPSSDINALLSSGSVSDFPNQLAMLDRMARLEQAQIAEVVALQNKYEAEKAKLDTLVLTQKKQETELAAKKKQINSELKRLEGQWTVAVSAGAGGACPAAPAPNSKARTAVRVACQQIGDPYVFGATGPNSFDCSGLTQFAWAAAGVSLTHFTGAQWKEGRSISRSEAKPGDLVFFFSDLHHVGMYIGNGKMVHAAREGKPVLIASIDNMPIAGFKRVY